MLVLVYVFNFLDRQILSILAERIKPTSASSDAQIGFLYGTAFAVFYALFGIPLGRLADVWDRRKLIALGLAFWSLMTALSGFARSFPELGAGAHRRRRRRGERGAGRVLAALRLLPAGAPRHRAGDLLERHLHRRRASGSPSAGWSSSAGTPRIPGAAPLGLRGWQVAFFVVGLPGLLLALWVRTLREPVRGASEASRRRDRERAVAGVRARAARRAAAAHAPPPLALGGRGARGVARNLARGGAASRAASALLIATARHPGAVDRARRSASTPPSRGCRRWRCATARRSR